MTIARKRSDKANAASLGTPAKPKKKTAVASLGPKPLNEIGNIKTKATSGLKKKVDERNIQTQRERERVPHKRCNDDH
jgi:hypothetical protein